MASRRDRELSKAMEVKVLLDYPRLKTISDRSFRDLIKFPARIIRKIQREEVKFLTKQFSLSQREDQSIHDRMERKIYQQSAFYISGTQHGSFSVTSMLSAAALYVLAVISKEAVKDTWKNSEIYKKIISYLEARQAQKSERWKFLKHQFETWFARGERIGRYQVTNLTIALMNNGIDMSVHIVLEMHEDYIDLADLRQLDSSTVAREVQNLDRRLNSQE